MDMFSPHNVTYIVPALPTRARNSNFRICPCKEQCSALGTKFLPGVQALTSHPKCTGCSLPFHASSVDLLPPALRGLPEALGCGHAGIVPLSVRAFLLAKDAPHSYHHLAMGALVAETLPVQIHPAIIAIVVVLLVWVPVVPVLAPGCGYQRQKYPQKSEVHAARFLAKKKKSHPKLSGLTFIQQPLTCGSQMWANCIQLQCVIAQAKAFPRWEIGLACIQLVLRWNSRNMRGTCKSRKFPGESPHKRIQASCSRLLRNT